MERLDNSYLLSSALWKKAFSLEEVLKIKELKNDYVLKKGVIGSANGFEEKDSVRKSSIFFFNNNEKTSWIFDKVNHCTDKTNREMFGFDLYRSEKAQYTLYNDSSSDFYRYHWDIFTNRKSLYPQRKLSVVLQLSDFEDYEGGSLLLNEGGVINEANKSIGSLVFFPSWLVHSIEPVRKGTRESLVFWFEGPNWR